MDSGSVPGTPSSHHDSRDGACRISGNHNAANREPWSIIGSAIVFRAIAGAASLRENEPTRRAATRGNRMQSVGVIRQLTRYPVKSMQGEALPSAALTLQGFAEDRRYAFRRPLEVRFLGSPRASCRSCSITEPPSKRRARHRWP